MKKPADTNQLAKRIVDLAVGEPSEQEPTRRPLGGNASANRVTAEYARSAPAARLASV